MDREMGPWIWSSISFWKKVDVKSTDECWPWLGSTGPQGALFGIRRRTLDGLKPQMVQARRVAAAEATGEYPGDKQGVYHLCKNKMCLNPQHFTFKKPSKEDYDKFNEQRPRDIT